ncbi:MAG: hypothetical protein ACREMW_09560 [Gemmatimonadales bacterium]
MTDPLSHLTAALADRYRLDRELGAGGMATVYLAHDLRHECKVAIKVLRPERAAVIGAERFLPQRHTVPPHVEAAVLKALEKLPADRFGTAAEFAAALS